MSGKKNKIKITFNLLSQISFVIWAVTFLFFLFLVSSNYESSKILSNLIFPVILFGVLTFTLGFTFLFLSRADNKKSQKKETKKTTKNIENETPKKFLVILLALVILFSAGLYVRAEKIERNLRDVDFKPKITPTPYPTATPTVIPTKVEQKIKIAPTPTSIPQPKSIPSPAINKIPVFLVHNSRTVYCPQENVDAVKTASQKAKEEQEKASSCYIKNSNDLFDCYGKCTQAMDNRDCVNYWHIYASSFEECLSYNSQEYEKCNNDCRKWKEILDKTCSSNYYTDYINGLVESLCN